MIDKGAMCMKMKSAGSISQQCDYTPGVNSLCAIAGTPTACCTTSTGAQITCSGSEGFSAAPSESDFASCTAKCHEGGAGGQTSDSASSGRRKASLGMLTLLFCVMSLFAGVGATECSLWLSPTLANPMGVVNCTSSGRASIDKGAACLKMKSGEMISQQCDYTPGVNSLCATAGNPAACCTTSTGAQIICSRTEGFNAAPSESDFEDCSARCQADGAGNLRGPVSQGAAGASLSVVAIIVSAVVAMRIA